MSSPDPRIPPVAPSTSLTLQGASSEANGIDAPLRSPQIAVGSGATEMPSCECLEVTFTKEADNEMSSGKVFEALNKIGDVRWIDFSNYHLDSTIVVAYFDLRAAQRAFVKLNEAELATSARYVPLPDGEEDRSVVLSISSTDSFDTIRKELTEFGDLYKMSFQDSSIVAVFYDSRAGATIKASLNSPGSKLKPAMGPALRLKSTMLPSKDRVAVHSSASSTGGSCSGAQRAAMMGYQQPRIIPSGGRVAAANSHASDSVTSGRLPKTTAVPNSQFQIDLDKVASGEDARTTCMIRNIPNKYTQKMLLKLFDSVPSLNGQYDFFYLPMDFRNKCNVGYAFIDFANPRTSIPALVRAFDGKKWERFNSEKICKISFARLQGSEQLMEHFRTSSVMQQSNKQIRPWFQRDRQTAASAHHSSRGVMGDYGRHHHQGTRRLSTGGFGSMEGGALDNPGGEAPMDYSLPLADLCAIGEPSLLASALAELQRNQEGSSSVILENFPLDGWSDGASSFGGFSAPATYCSDPTPSAQSLPTLGGYNPLTWTEQASPYGVPSNLWPPDKSDRERKYSPFPSQPTEQEKQGSASGSSSSPFGVRSGLNIRIAGEFAAVVEWGQYIVFAKASGPLQATGALVAVGRQHDRLSLDVNVSASSVGVTGSEDEKRAAESICDDVASTIASGLSGVVVAEHYPKSVLPINVSVISYPPGGFSAEWLLPCAMAAAMTATALCVQVSDLVSIVNVVSRGSVVLSDPSPGEDLPNGEETDGDERRHLTTLGLTYVGKDGEMKLNDGRFLHLKNVIRIPYFIIFAFLLYPEGDERECFLAMKKTGGAYIGESVTDIRQLEFLAGICGRLFDVVLSKVLLLRSSSSASSEDRTRKNTKPDISKILTCGFSATTQVSREIERVIAQQAAHRKET
ncbi:hypothetical protein FOL47_005609 [Perkinsus chesapeaki]|uniref:RRM domain-containing protein n=1 Tax=Perkinsus chesapeaki TaxID=330153 RepID=A0A7J6MYF1_PERCH|nr:hypothetical protein FOL47_005609 [Perkinsus chesapeaki]